VSNEAIDWAIKQDAAGNAPRKLILILLANRADDAWVCWPSRRLLAEESGLSPRQVVRHLASLEEDGLIRRVAWERADGGQGANVYVLGPGDSGTPVSCTTRGGGRVRHGGMTPKTPGGGHARHPKNPQEKPTPKPSSSAAREESRRRSPADAGEAHTTKPTLTDLYEAVNRLHRDQEAAERQAEAIRSRAPRLWRDAVELATGQLREKQPEGALNQAAVRRLAHQYALRERDPNWPAWLLGPLLPLLPTPD
jgi:DNA-binding transcriptional ArsR family regulator